MLSINLCVGLPSSSFVLALPLISSKNSPKILLESSVGAQMAASPLGSMKLRVCPLVGEHTCARLCFAKYRDAFSCSSCLQTSRAATNEFWKLREVTTAEVTDIEITTLPNNEKHLNSQFQASGMCHLLALVRTNVSKKCIAIIRAKGISELGTNNVASYC
jgi:hypothetical protein